jgi:hypothetical protein
MNHSPTMHTGPSVGLVPAEATIDSYKKVCAGQLSVRLPRTKAAIRACVSCHASASPVPPGRARRRPGRSNFTVSVAVSYGSADARSTVAVSNGVRRREADGNEMTRGCGQKARSFSQPGLKRSGGRGHRPQERGESQRPAALLWTGRHERMASRGRKSSAEPGPCRSFVRRLLREPTRFRHSGEDGNSASSRSAAPQNSRTTSESGKKLLRPVKLKRKARL